MKICMIGVRGHNGYVLRDLGDLPQVEVAGLCAGTEEDDIEALRKSCGDAGHRPEVFDDYCRMLDAIKPDALTVAGPCERRADMCIEAFRRGVHVFSEKPVVTTLEDLDRVRRTHADSGVHFAAMMGLRYEPAFYTAWRTVREGNIGTVRLISTRKSYKLGQRPSYYRVRETYGGTIPWVGSHAIDWIYWFGGQPFRSVYATHTTRCNRALGDMEMSALCHFTLAEEVFASVTMDYLRHENAPTHGDDRVRVAGTEGVIEVRDRELFLINAEAEGEQKPDVSCERTIFRDFIDHIEGKSTALITASEVLAVAEAYLLAQRSADEGRVLMFP